MSTYKLQYPVEYGEETISEIKVNRPTAKVFKKYPLAKMQDMTVDQWLGIISQLTGLEQTKIDKFDMKDALAVISIVGEMLDDGQ